MCVFVRNVNNTIFFAEQKNIYYRGITSLISIGIMTDNTTKKSTQRLHICRIGQILSFR